MDLDAVIVEVTARLAAGPVPRSFAYIPGDITPPCAAVAPAPGDFLVYDATVTGDPNLHLLITLITGLQLDRSSAPALNQYLATTGAMSIRAAVNARGYTTCDYARVMSVRSYGTIEVDGVHYGGCQFMVEVACEL